MTTYIPPAHSNIAAPLDWETATMEDVWEVSDLAGVSACTILGAAHKILGGNAKLSR